MLDWALSLIGRITVCLCVCVCSRENYRLLAAYGGCNNYYLPWPDAISTIIGESATFECYIWTLGAIRQEVVRQKKKLQST